MTDRLVTFRDRYLLPGSPGRDVVDFYYRHTLLAAETIRAPEGDAGLRHASGLGLVALVYGGVLFVLFVSAGVLGLLIAILYRKASAKWANPILAVAFLAAIGAMLGVLANHSAEIRKVGEIRTAGIPDLNKLYQHLCDANDEVQYEAAYRACHLLPRGAAAAGDLFGPLVSATRDNDLRVRLWACTALGLLGNPHAADALEKALGDRELLVRCRAAEALGRLGASEAVDALERIVTTDAWYVGVHAQKALRRIEPD
jgi:hypothetical protein